MKKPLSPSATAQRAFRERMRQKGLVPRQLYVRLEHVDRLASLEKILQLPALPPFLYTMDTASMNQQWNVSSLFEALKSSEFAPHVTMSLLDGAEPAIHLELHAMGDLPMHIVTAGGEIRVSTALCHADQVKDRTAFNDACLRLNTLYPLSNLGLTQIDGEDTYIVFGQLSALSPLANVIEEVTVLGHNTIQAAHELHSLLH